MMEASLILSELGPKCGRLLHRESTVIDMLTRRMRESLVDARKTNSLTILTLKGKEHFLSKLAR